MMVSARQIYVLDAGLIGYAKGLKLQEELSNLVKQKSNIHGVLVILQHNPVYTVGIRNYDYNKEHFMKLGAEFYKTNRGGLITFHGPGQLVSYPILNLKYFQPSIRWYVSQLENVIINLCNEFNIKRNTSPHTGVWVNDNKICAIGVHASQFVTTHGLALNCNTDLKWFSYITPCGIVDKGVTSLSKELGKIITVEKTINIFLNSFANIFNCNLSHNLDDDIVKIINSIN